MDPIESAFFFLLSSFGRNTDEITLGAYRLGIADMAPEALAAEVTDAVRWWVQNGGSHLPTPSEFRQTILDDRANRKKAPVVDGIYDRYELEAVKTWDKSKETYHEALERVHAKYGIATVRGPHFVTRDGPPPEKIRVNLSKHKLDEVPF